MAKNKNNINAQLAIWICVSSAAVVLVVSALCFYGYRYATNMVRSELAAQKIYFPPAGSPALSAEEYPELQKYGGQLVDDGFKAKAYANGFIGRHLQKIAGGKTYSEVSAAANADPTNERLQQQKTALFQGETLRGILLGTGYAFWIMGLIALAVSVSTLLIGVGLLLVAFILHRKK